jgi:hypothetical protein
LSPGGDENVGGLDIAMNDAARAGGVQRVGNLRAEFKQGIGGHGAAADTFAQGLPFEEFHHEEGLAIVLADVVNGANARMIQGGRGAGFALKTFERRRIFGEVGRQEFESDLAAETRVFGSKNLAHAAAAQGVDDPVM